MNIHLIHEICYFNYIGTRKAPNSANMWPLKLSMWSRVW